MEQVKITESIRSDVTPEIADDDPAVLKMKFIYAPKQIVLLRIIQTDTEHVKIPITYQDKAVDVLGVIRNLKLSGISPAPQCEVDIYAFMKTGEPTGGLSLTLAPNRYESPNPIEDKHLKLLNNHPDAKDFFYVSRNEKGEYFKIYPFCTV